MKFLPLILAVALVGCNVARKPIDPNQPIGPDNKPKPGPIVVSKSLDRGAYCESLASEIESGELTSHVRLCQIIMSHSRAGRIDQATFDAISAAFPAATKERQLTADDAKTLRGLKG